MPKSKTVPILAKYAIIWRSKYNLDADNFSFFPYMNILPSFYSVVRIPVINCKTAIILTKL